MPKGTAYLLDRTNLGGIGGAAAVERVVRKPIRTAPASSRRRTAPWSRWKAPATAVPTGSRLLAASVTILLLGRALLGVAESFIITGAVTWGLALVGPQNAGRVIAWIGMAMFAALAFGAPLGTTLYAVGGFAAVAVATMLLPLATVLLVAPLHPVPPQHGARPATIAS
jgi:MFS family permease